MSNLVKLATARDLVNAGVVIQAEVVGLPGGWIVHLQTNKQARVLSTKSNEPRRFGTFESALKVLRDLGVRPDLLRVDAARWEAEGPAGRRRPDRSAAMKLKEADARYAAHLRQSVEQARADTRPRLSSAAAKRHMDEVKARHRAQLDTALTKDGRA